MGLACKRALDGELARLDAEFANWRSGRLDSFELEAKSHRFHQGPARELYKLSATDTLSALLARAIMES